MSLWDNWKDERGCDESHWHAHTRWLPWGLPELLEWYKCIAARGDYFEGDKSFMCVLSIKVPIRKKSGYLFNDPRMTTLSRNKINSDLTKNNNKIRRQTQ